MATIHTSPTTTAPSAPTTTYDGDVVQAAVVEDSRLHCTRPAVVSLRFIRVVGTSATFFPHEARAFAAALIAAAQEAEERNEWCRVNRRDAL